MTSLITLESFKWYTWQMLPGYTDSPYFSPIFVREITPLKSGKNTLKLHFVNAMYAAGVKGFELDIQVLRRMRSYLIADLKYSDRTAIISEINYKWIERFTPSLLDREGTRNVPDPFTSDIQNYLSAYFTGDPENHRKEKEAAQRS